MSAAAAVAKAVSAVLSGERGRKAFGWILAAVFFPLILLIAILCSLGTGSSDHNNAVLHFGGKTFCSGSGQRPGREDVFQNPQPLQN